MIDASAFAGPWIGETIGHDSSAHLWEIKVTGRMIHIETQWEGETHRETIYGMPIQDEPAFMLQDKKAILIDSQHFVIAGWDTNEVRGGKGPHYDVVFSRPGIAELGAQEAYRRFKSMGKT
jgi:hypothetical protein